MTTDDNTLFPIGKKSSYGLIDNLTIYKDLSAVGIAYQKRVERQRTMAKIIHLAETNPTLNDQLEKLEELYVLLKD